MNCPGGASNATGVLSVSGAAGAAGAAAQPADAQLAAATVGYTSYVEGQARILQTRTRAFGAAVKAGDLGRAKALFAPARAPYESIEPVAESFGDLDPEIDARVNDVVRGQQWTGFHRIEQGLFARGGTRGLAPVRGRARRRRQPIGGQGHGPALPARRAGQRGQQPARRGQQVEDHRRGGPHSHTDLSDFEANVLGSQTAFGLLAPALRQHAPALAATIGQRFADVLGALGQYKRGTGYVSYATVDQAARRRLSQLVDALAEPLSQVAANLR
jgi:iron uptake system component EfeO